MDVDSCRAVVYLEEYHDQPEARNPVSSPRMSSDNDVRPFHARDEATSGQEAADAVAAVLKHAHDRDEAQHIRAEEKKPAKWMLPLGINLAVFAVYLLIAPPSWVTVHPIENPNAGRVVEDLRLAMYLQAQRIESYRIRNGRLPEDLSETGSTLPNIRYVPLGVTEYQLVGTVQDTALVYDSDTPSADFVGEAANRLTAGG